MNDSKQLIDWASWITAISAFTSAVILIFYTYYTWRMQKAVEAQVKELVHQKCLGIMPAILVEIKNQILILTNVGNGTALNIVIKPIQQKSNSKANSETLEKYVFRVSILRLGEQYSRAIPFNSWDKMEDQIISFVEISFTDILGIEYKGSLQNIGNDLKYGFPNIVKE